MKKKTWYLLIIFLATFSINVKALELDINSKHAILYNLNDGSILYEKNSEEKTSIASLTKIMTAIVAIENIDNLDEKVVLTSQDFAGLVEANAAVAGFQVREEVTYRDLLYGLLFPSGADAAQALARNIAGSIDEYMDLMNEKAKELKLNTTHFVNPVGLDDEEHYSTVEEVAKIFQYAIQNNEFLEIIKNKKYTTSNGRITFKNPLKRMSDYYDIEMDYVLGGKTGTTGDAGYCLATIANYDGVDYMLVTTRTDYPSNKPLALLDAKTIYEYFINHYSYQNVISKEDKLVTIKTKYAKKDKIDFYGDKEIEMYLEKTFDKKKLTYQYTGVDTITLDMKKGKKLGIVEVYYENKLLTTVDITLQEKQELDLIKYLNGHKLEIGISLVFLIILISSIIMIGKKKKKVQK